LSRSLPAPRLIALALVLATLGGVRAAHADPLVAVGEVEDTSAVLWVRGAAEGTVRVRYGPDGSGDHEREAALAVADATDLTGRLRLAGLAPGTRYRYRVSSAGRHASGTFLTAPRPSVAAPVRLVWSGDLGSSKHCRRPGEGYAIFRPMADRRPDFFLFVGDTIYADHSCNMPDAVPGADFVATTLGGFRAKHRHQRRDPALAALLAVTSVYAIWDDHDVRNDFAGPHEPLMPIGRQAFLEYWPLAPPDEEPGRLYRSARWGALVEVFILDTRQYRSANAEPDGPAKTMLGPAQRRWLIERVTGSDAVWKIVVSSVPLSVPTGRAGRDSWSNAAASGQPREGETGFAVERDALLRAFRQRGVRNLVVLAADVHHAELIRHHPAPEFSFHEFIAGPLSASTGAPRALDRGLGPRSLYGHGGSYTFGELTVEREVLTVRVVDAAGTVLFTHAIGPE
jgi:alkaline phosphatase D